MGINRNRARPGDIAAEVPGLQGETVTYEWIKVDSRCVKTLVPLIEANPGIESRKLAELAGLSYTHVKNGLAVISRNKIAGWVEMGRKKRGWFMQPEADRRMAEFISVKQQQKMRAAQKPPTARDQIMVMAQQDGDGASIAKVSERMDLGRKDAHRHLLQMVKQVRLYLSRRPGCVGRWFDTAERAQAWEALPAAEVSEWRKKPGRPPSVNKPPKLVAIGERIKNANRQPSKAPPLLKGSQKAKPVIKAIPQKPGVDAAVTLKGKATDMRGEIDYSRAKITICPAPVSIYRYQYDPGSDAHRAYVRQIEQLRGAA